MSRQAAFVLLPDLPATPAPAHAHQIAAAKKGAEAAKKALKSRQAALQAALAEAEAADGERAGLQEALLAAQKSVKELEKQVGGWGGGCVGGASRRRLAHGLPAQPRGALA